MQMKEVIKSRMLSFGEVGNKVDYEPIPLEAIASTICRSVRSQLNRRSGGRFGFEPADAPLNLPCPSSGRYPRLPTLCISTIE